MKNMKYNKINKIALSLFNGVVSNDIKKDPVFIDKYGVIVPSNGVYALQAIHEYLDDLKLSGVDLNKTFHKTWEKIVNSSRIELAIEQIRHYMSTYGTDMTGEIYIPNETVNLPPTKLSLTTINVFSVDELIEKSLNMFRSGIALKQETIKMVFSLLELLRYDFTGNEEIRNKEAQTILMDDYGVFPSNNPLAVLRFVVYKATDSTLLIKNSGTIAKIKGSSYDPSYAFNKAGLVTMSEIFNRFKPLFLAFKGKNRELNFIINKISRLSKDNHKAMVQNPLNLVTSQMLTDKDGHWLENATNFALLKAMHLLHNRIHGQTNFAYKIRNGKSWVNLKSDVVSKSKLWKHNFNVITTFLKTRLRFDGTTFVIPKNVRYGLPTSEKMFVGNIPTGTKFTAKRLITGIYWTNSGGARDLDLSGVSIDGRKVGWDSSYTDNGLYYSGDITNAPTGAVEYLFADRILDAPMLVQNNVFSGSPQSEYKILVGKGEKLSHPRNDTESEMYQYMMNPNKCWVQVPSNSIEKQTILGLYYPDGKKNTFCLLNLGAGNLRVSGNTSYTTKANEALYEEYKNSLTFNDLVTMLGGKIAKKMPEMKFDDNGNEIVDENVYVDLSLDNLQKDTFINILK